MVCAIKKRRPSVRRTAETIGGSVMEYIINLKWDNDASVWVATSDDISGLALEGGSLDALIERIRFAAPELLALNSEIESTLNLTFLSTRREQIAI